MCTELSRSEGLQGTVNGTGGGTGGGNDDSFDGLIALLAGDSQQNRALGRTIERD